LFLRLTLPQPKPRQKRRKGLRNRPHQPGSNHDHISMSGTISCKINGS
jgi:hypothetical protein